MKTLKKQDKRRKQEKNKPISPWLEHRTRVLESYDRLRDKGLLGDDHLSISVRIPGRAAFAVFGADLGTGGRKPAAPRTTQVAILDFAGDRLPHTDGEELPNFKKSQELFAIHGSIYENRPDVGAIVMNRPQWGGALALLEEPMPGIFDEQARQMGRGVERLFEATAQNNKEKAAGLTTESQKRLQSGANVFLINGHALCLGMTRERAIFTSELLEKCAKAYVLALATGQKIHRIPWFVRFIANRRLLKDERRSAESYARGEIPTGFTAY